MKKIAFLFLIYDIIHNEELWHKFFTNADSSCYTIYIHYKINKPLKYFEKYKLKNCIPTKWGDISLVKAQNLLLKSAYNDNSLFCFISNSCIPLKPFSHIYDLNDEFSYFSKMGGDYRERVKQVPIDKTYIKKVNQWCILNKKHANLMLTNQNYLLWFKYVIASDEHCYITNIYYHHLEHEIKYREITYTQWYMNKPLTYISLTQSQLKQLIGSPYLFMRKFINKFKIIHA